MASIYNGIHTRYQCNTVSIHPGLLLPILDYCYLTQSMNLYWTTAHVAYAS